MKLPHERLPLLSSFNKITSNAAISRLVIWENLLLFKDGLEGFLNSQ